ncbi:MAG: type II/IV secretion system protein [Ramlibacter sp.]|nr:type II/IV secretion system protein [Ramlibacter sp.]
MTVTETISLGQWLVKKGLLEASALERANVVLAQSRQEKLGSILIRMGLLSEQTLLASESELFEIPLLSESQLVQSLPRVTQWLQEGGISHAMARRLQFFAYPADEATDLIVATREPFDSELLEYLESGPARGLTLQFHLTATRNIERALEYAYRPAAPLGGSEDLRKLAEDAPVVELVNGLLARATDGRASDIHLEPQENGFIVRYRIDGQLQGVEQYPRDRFDAVVSRIKLVSGLDIAERRLPQDGRFSSRMAGIETDVRVSVIPGVQGESLVLRLLPNTQSTRFDLNNIGIEPDHLAMYREWMTQPDGIVLVTGPTGSGKSTTLYATLVATDTAHERVMTVEDPVEYKIPGVTQFQVHPDIGFTFPSALRSILRHDPDTIMIGEIRDVETARIAVQASLTGHRVFSTLHTNDTVTAFLRLADMGVESFLVGATVRGVVAQRLLRRLCFECAEPLDHALVPDSIAKMLLRNSFDKSKWAFRRSVGCQHCNNTGYRGRIAVYELLPASEKLREVMSRGNPTIDALISVVGPNFRDLRGDGLLKAVRGITSLEEVYSMSGGSFAASH